MNLVGVEGSALLIEALMANSPDQAYRAWRQWYKSADIDRLSWESMQIVPALGGQLWNWLRDDPAAGIVQGIVRRAWTEAQVRLAAARSAIDSIEAAGCSPVVLAGPAAVSLLNQREDAVRPVTLIRLIVRREQLFIAASALESSGWELSGRLPSPDALDRVNCVFYTRNEIGLLLHWRLLPMSGPLVSACEAEFLANHQSVTCCGRRTLIPATEHILLAALSERVNPDPDIVPWQVDAALLPLAKINWPKWSALAATYAPEAFDRLEEMRNLGLDVPKLTRPPAPKPASPRRLPVPLHKRIYRSLRRRAGRFVRQCLPV